MARKKSNGIMAAPSSSHEDRWRTEEDLRTLQRAAEVKADSKRLKAAMNMHEQQRRGMQSIVGEAPKPSRSTHRQRLNQRRI